MTMTRRALLSTALLMMPGVTRGQLAPPIDKYTPSDPARIGGTGRPQLVEFYHPL